MRRAYLLAGLVGVLSAVALLWTMASRSTARNEEAKEAKKEASKSATASQLPIGQVSRRSAQGVRVGMRRNQRCTRKFGDIPEPLLVNVREIDQYAHLVTTLDQRLAEIGQAVARIGR